MTIHLRHVVIFAAFRCQASIHQNKFFVLATKVLSSVWDAVRPITKQNCARFALLKIQSQYVAVKIIDQEQSNNSIDIQKVRNRDQIDMVPKFAFVNWHHSLNIMENSYSVF